MTVPTRIDVETPRRGPTSTSLYFEKLQRTSSYKLMEI